MNALSVRSLAKSFGEKKAVRAVDLDVEHGELMAILGPSGCGKTTLLRLVMGEITPDAGRIFIMGEDMTAVPTHRRDIGFVFQAFALFPHMTVLENVMFPLLVRNVERRERERRAEELLALVRLAGHAGLHPGELSGGEQQRVGLARALVYRPKLILLDEPLSNLDAKLREEMRGEVRRLVRDLGMTAVYVTHDQEEALSIADRLAVMHEGEIRQVGIPEEIYRRPATEFVAVFVGASKLIPAVAAEEGLFLVEGLQVGVPGPAGFTPGEKLLAVLKPEELRIRKREGEAAPQELAGTLVSSSYRGARTEYLAESVTGIMLRVLDERKDIAPGDEILVLLPPRLPHMIPRA
jgi:ABC-type Fe3+/spermidine/putrescine transport system ATPase subunit